MDGGRQDEMKAKPSARGSLVRPHTGMAGTAWSERERGRTDEAVERLEDDHQLSAGDGRLGHVHVISVWLRDREGACEWQQNLFAAGRGSWQLLEAAKPERTAVSCGSDLLGAAWGA